MTTHCVCVCVCVEGRSCTFVDSGLLYLCVTKVANSSSFLHPHSFPTNRRRRKTKTKSREGMKQVKKRRWRATTTFFDASILHNKQAERQKTLADVFSADSEVRKCSQRIPNFHNVLIPSRCSYYPSPISTFALYDNHVKEAYFPTFIFFYLRI